MHTHLFTSESVSDGHPDKICDQISDALLDLYLTQDPNARCAIECAVTTNRVFLLGEYRLNKGFVTQAMIDNTIRNLIKTIGYDQEGFHHEHVEIANFLHAQSADIAMGVDASMDKAEGAGDQGIMFGYAVGESPDLMPAPIYYAHKILLALKAHRDHNPLLKPDAKAQVTLRYVNDQPTGVEAVVLSTQHDESVSLKDVKAMVMPLIQQVFEDQFDLSQTKFYINPTGRFVIGGPVGDSGLTGRKIIVDTYGGACPHGGGAFSGKDPTKVDRSSAYMARYLAKNIVASGLSNQCLIQLSYAIGVAEPVSLYVKTDHSHDTNHLVDVLYKNFDLTPAGIRQFLGLNQPFYLPTASYGHFGRSEFPWEKTDSVGLFS